MIAELARVHGIDVVVEGIETETTRALVRSTGCGFGQGFLFAAAVPFGELAAGRRHPVAG